MSANQEKLKNQKATINDPNIQSPNGNKPLTLSPMPTKEDIRVSGSSDDQSQYDVIYVEDGSDDGFQKVLSKSDKKKKQAQQNSARKSSSSSSTNNKNNHINNNINNQTNKNKTQTTSTTKSKSNKKNHQNLNNSSNLSPPGVVTRLGRERRRIARDTETVKVKKEVMLEAEKARQVKTNKQTTLPFVSHSAENYNSSFNKNQHQAQLRAGYQQGRGRGQAMGRGRGRGRSGSNVFQGQNNKNSQHVIDLSQQTSGKTENLKPNRLEEANKFLTQIVQNNKKIPLPNKQNQQPTNLNKNKQNQANQINQKPKQKTPTKSNSTKVPATSTESLPPTNKNQGCAQNTPQQMPNQNMKGSITPNSSNRTKSYKETLQQTPTQNINDSPNLLGEANSPNPVVTQNATQTPTRNLQQDFESANPIINPNGEINENKSPQLNSNENLIPDPEIQSSDIEKIKNHSSNKKTDQSNGDNNSPKNASPNTIHLNKEVQTKFQQDNNETLRKLDEEFEAAKTNLTETQPLNGLRPYLPSIFGSGSKATATKVNESDNKGFIRFFGSGKSSDDITSSPSQTKSKEKGTTPPKSILKTPTRKVENPYKPKSPSSKNKNKNNLKPFWLLSYMGCACHKQFYEKNLHRKNV